MGKENRIFGINARKSSIFRCYIGDSDNGESKRGNFEKMESEDGNGGQLGSGVTGPDLETASKGEDCNKLNFNFPPKIMKEDRVDLEGLEKGIFGLTNTVKKNSGEGPMN